MTSVLSLVLVWGGGSGAPHQTQASSKLNLSVALEDVLTRPPIPLGFILMFPQSRGFCRAPSEEPMAPWLAALVLQY